jgi:Tfp pilus assembly protein FimV
MTCKAGTLLSLLSGFERAAEIKGNGNTDREENKSRVSITSAEVPEEYFKVGVLRW